MSTYTSVCSALFVAAFLSASVAVPLSAQPGGDRATSIKPGESCPPGMTEIRPRSCMGPEEPAPSVLDYRPKSTLVTPEHVVKKARYRDRFPRTSAGDARLR